MGIRPDDVQYLDLYNEYKTSCMTNGEKVSYIVEERERKIWA